MHALRNVGLRYLPQDKDILRAVVNTVTKLPASIKCGQFLDKPRND